MALESKSNDDPVMYIASQSSNMIKYTDELNGVY